MFSGNADLRSVPLMWLLRGFAAAAVVPLVLVLQFFTYSMNWPQNVAQSHVWGHFFPCESHCKVSFSSLQLWDLPGPAATKKEFINSCNSSSLDLGL